MSILLKESNKIQVEIGNLVKRIAVLTIKDLLDKGKLNNQMDDEEIEGAINEALKGKEKKPDEDQCTATLKSGVNKGSVCKNKKTKFSNFCSRHDKMSQKEKGNTNQTRKMKVQKIVEGDNEFDIKKEKLKSLGHDYYLWECNNEEIVLEKTGDEYKAVGHMVNEELQILSSKAKFICLRQGVSVDETRFKELEEKRLF